MEELDISNLGPWDGLKKIMEFINKETQFDKLTTNAHLGTFLMDAFESQNLPVIKPSTTITKNPKTYKIIKLKHADVFIDPNMRWDDNRLIFSNENLQKEIVVKHSNNLI
jgi:hypothetical protein